MPRTLFISDLHLARARPASTEALFAFLEREGGDCERLYILGDLFEYWVGDDDLADPFNASIAGALARAAASGVEVLVMHGNHDFLIDGEFCSAARASLIADPQVIDLYGRRAILLHGDTLCTNDIDYQNWRRTARSAEWQRDFLADTLSVRHSRALALREKSREMVREKTDAVMDASEAAVRTAFREHGVDLMIHGHTHRPAHHTLEVAGRPCERWVLPEWYGQGGYLSADPAGLKLHKL